MPSTMTTTVKDLSDQAMTIIASMSEMIEAVRAASRTASRAELYELIVQSAILTDLVARMTELMEGEDPENMLLDVLKQANDVMLEMDEIF
ncbi:hypothetical protein FPCIR_9688 [Fusarium pseudocircinatum]|uniref:Uncharacterized protein n=1 Tax=Fusarium pseudocircinatum TaxID=56676 RepID=A0A8H5L197_9HYPO|nr:hypothetical protein FPCIR_9688 [Fusarium pseudocircinatum]